MYFKKNLKEKKIRRFDLCLLKQTKKKDERGERQENRGRPNVQSFDTRLIIHSPIIITKFQCTRLIK